MSENSNILPDVEHIETISGHTSTNMAQINSSLKNGWVLLGITIKRHAKSEPEYYDEAFYIIGKRRSPLAAR